MNDKINSDANEDKRIVVSQPYPGFIKIVILKEMKVQCYYILPKPLFKEPDPILIKYLKKEICNVLTDDEKARSLLLKSILASVKFKAEGTKISYENIKEEK